MLVEVPSLEYTLDSINDFLIHFYAKDGLNNEYSDMLKLDKPTETPYIVVAEKYLVKLKSDHKTARMIVRFPKPTEIELLDVSSITQLNKNLFCLETNLIKEQLNADTETTFFFSDGVVNIVITHESPKLQCIHFLFDLY